MRLTGKCYYKYSLWRVAELLPAHDMVPMDGIGWGLVTSKDGKRDVVCYTNYISYRRGIMCGNYDFLT